MGAAKATAAAAATATALAEASLAEQGDGRHGRLTREKRSRVGCTGQRLSSSWEDARSGLASRAGRCEEARALGGGGA